MRFSHLRKVPLFLTINITVTCLLPQYSLAGGAASSTNNSGKPLAWPTKPVSVDISSSGSAITDPCSVVITDFNDQNSANSFICPAVAITGNPNNVVSFDGVANEPSILHTPCGCINNLYVLDHCTSCSITFGAFDTGISGPGAPGTATCGNVEITPEFVAKVCKYLCQGATWNVLACYGGANSAGLNYPAVVQGIFNNCNKVAFVRGCVSPNDLGDGQLGHAPVVYNTITGKPIQGPQDCLIPEGQPNAGQLLYPNAGPICRNGVINTYDGGYAGVVPPAPVLKSVVDATPQLGNDSFPLILVNWEHSATNHASFEIKRTEGGSTVTFNATYNQRQYVDYAVQRGKTYKYKVIAKNSAGSSPPSAEKSITLPP